MLNEIPFKAQKKLYLQVLLYICVAVSIFIAMFLGIEIASWVFIGLNAIGYIFYGAKFGFTDYSPSFYEGKVKSIVSELSTTVHKKLLVFGISIAFIYCLLLYPFFNDSSIFGICFNAFECQWELPVDGIGNYSVVADILYKNAHVEAANHLKLYTSFLYVVSLSVFIYFHFKYRYILMIMLDEKNNMLIKRTTKIQLPKQIFGLSFFVVLTFYLMHLLLFAQGGDDLILLPNFFAAISPEFSYTGNLFFYDYVFAAFEIWTFSYLGAAISIFCSVKLAAIGTLCRNQGTAPDN